MYVILAYRPLDMSDDRARHESFLAMFSERFPNSTIGGITSGHWNLSAPRGGWTRTVTLNVGRDDRRELWRLSAYGVVIVL